MGQFGMHMPGGTVKPRATLNVYTGLMALAVVAMLGAALFVAMRAGRISPDGGPFSLQPDTSKPENAGKRINFRS